MGDDPAVLVIAHVLPLAAGAAVSPAVLAVSVEILLAFTTRGRRMLLAYLVGAAVVVAVAIGLSAVLPRRAASSGGSRVADIVDLVFAAVLIVVALLLVFRRPSGARAHRTATGMLTSRWVGLAVLAVGALMMATNISTLVLVLAGAHEVTSATGDPVVRTVGYGMLAVGALAPILLPLLWAVIRPSQATRDLQRLSAIITKHDRPLGVVASGLTALYLLARGLGLI